MRAPSSSRGLPHRPVSPWLLPVVLVLAAGCGADAPPVPPSAPAAVESALGATASATEPTAAATTSPQRSTTTAATTAATTASPTAGTTASPTATTTASPPGPARATSSSATAASRSPRSREPGAPPASSAAPRQDDEGRPEAAPPRETTPPPGAPPCRARDLTVQDADAVYVAAAVHELFTIRTAGPDCTLRGVPKVSFRDAAGRTLRVDVRAGGLGLPAEAARPVTISRATSLSFFVATPRDGACEQAAVMVTTLPGTDRALLVDTMMQVCGRTAALSPVRLNASRE